MKKVILGLILMLVTSFVFAQKEQKVSIIEQTIQVIPLKSEVVYQPTVTDTEVQIVSIGKQLQAINADHSVCIRPPNCSTPDINGSYSPVTYYHEDGTANAYCYTATSGGGFYSLTYTLACAYCTWQMP